MAFKQKSSGTFKMMGSSPVKKQKVPKISLGMGGEADNNLAKKLSSQPKNFNTKGGVSKTPGHSSTKIAKTQNFRDAANKIKTVSSKTSGKGGKVVQSLVKPGATDATKSIGPKNTIKSELKKGVKRFVESAKGQWKGFKPPKVSSKIVKVATTLGKAARVVGKASQAGLVVEAGYQAYKSGQKHSDGKVNKNQKSFMSDAKKNTKSVWKK